MQETANAEAILGAQGSEQIQETGRHPLLYDLFNAEAVGETANAEVLALRTEVEKLRAALALAPKRAPGDVDPWKETLRQRLPLSGADAPLTQYEELTLEETGDAPVLALRSEVNGDCIIIQIGPNRNDLEATRDFLSHTLDSLAATKFNKNNLMDHLLATTSFRRGDVVFSWAEKKISATFALPPDDIDYHSHVQSMEAREKKVRMGCDVRLARVLLMEGRGWKDEDLQGNSHEATSLDFSQEFRRQHRGSGSLPMKSHPTKSERQTKSEPQIKAEPPTKSEPPMKSEPRMKSERRMKSEAQDLRPFFS